SERSGLPEHALGAGISHAESCRAHATELESRAWSERPERADAGNQASGEERERAARLALIDACARRWQRDEVEGEAEASDLDATLRRDPERGARQRGRVDDEAGRYLVVDLRRLGRWRTRRDRWERNGRFRRWREHGG